MSDGDLHFRAVTMKTARDFSFLRQEHAAFSNCSCMRWRLRYIDFMQATREERERAIDTLVACGTPVGILAYLEGIPVGWCSIAPRETFDGLAGVASTARIKGSRSWSVTCLYVVPRHRSRGIGYRLLRAAVEYAKAQGAHVIEGYPAERQQRSRPGMGSASMFRQAGFRDATPPGRKQRVMRNVVG